MDNSNFYKLINQFNTLVMENNLKVSDIMDAFGVPYATEGGAIRLGSVANSTDDKVNKLCEHMGLYHAAIGNSGHMIPRFEDKFKQKGGDRPQSFRVTNSVRGAFAPLDFVRLALSYSNPEFTYGSWEKVRGEKADVQILEGCNQVIGHHLPKAKEDGNLLVIDEIGDYQRKLNECVDDMGLRAGHHSVMSGEYFKSFVQEYLPEEFLTSATDKSIVVLRQSRSGDYNAIVVDSDGDAIDASRSGFSSFTYAGAGVFGLSNGVSINADEYADIILSVVEYLAGFRTPESVVAELTAAFGFENVPPHGLDKVVLSIPNLNRRAVMDKLSRLKAGVKISTTGVEELKQPTSQDDKSMSISFSAINDFGQVVRAILSSQDISGFPLELTTLVRAAIDNLSSEDRASLYDYVADADNALMERFPSDYPLVGQDKASEIGLSGTAMMGVPPMLSSAALDYLNNLLRANDCSQISGVASGILTQGAISARDIINTKLEEVEVEGQVIRRPVEGNIVRFLTDTAAALKKHDPQAAEDFASAAFKLLKQPLNDFYEQARVYGPAARKLAKKSNPRSTDVSVFEFCSPNFSFYNFSGYEDMNLATFDQVLCRQLLMVGVFVGSQEGCGISLRTPDNKYRPLIDYKTVANLTSLASTALSKSGLSLTSDLPRLRLARELNRGFILPLTMSTPTDDGFKNSWSGVLGRGLQGEDPKYLRVGSNLPGVNDRFLEEVVRTGGEFNVVEGEVDAYWMQFNGFPNTVASATVAIRTPVLQHIRNLVSSYCKNKGIDTPTLKPTLYVEDAAGNLGAERSVKNVLSLPGFGYIKVVYFNEANAKEKLDANDLLSRPDGLTQLKARQDDPDRSFVINALYNMVPFTRKDVKAGNVDHSRMVRALWSIARHLSPSDRGISPDTVMALRHHPQVAYWIKQCGFEVASVFETIEILTPGVSTYPPRTNFGMESPKGPKKT